MSVLWEELTAGLSDSDHLLRVVIRLAAAILCGGLIGLQRESVGKSAGLRTHALVSLGTTFVVVACSATAMSLDGLSRGIQGIVTGIGFIGAGTILKLSEEHAIRGLTTSASIWVTAAVGVAVGLGKLGMALVATFVTLVILGVVGALERRVEKGKSR